LRNFFVRKKSLHTNPNYWLFIDYKHMIKTIKSF